MKRILTSLALLLIALASFAQHDNIRDYISVAFTPNHADWTYQLNEEVSIDMAVIRHYVPVPDCKVTYTWGTELRDPELTKTVNMGKTGRVTLRLKGANAPGFKTLKATVTIDGKEYKNLINIAFNPTEIQPTTSLPKDFEDFWEKAVSDGRKVPLEPLLTPKPELSTPYCDVYEVRFQNQKKGCYLYGTLSVPKTPGPHPAVIEWPGAGVKPHLGVRSFFPEHDVVTLEMGINGIPVTLDQQVYTDLRANGMKDYQTFHNDDRDLYYYKKVYAGTVKAVDLLCALPFVDATRIGVYGGSQGGCLAIVNAALDPRIKCVSAAYPAMCEIAGYYHGRSEGWPHVFKKANEPGLEQKVAVSEYYDVVNFARLVKCPMLFFIGYNDQVCCPTSTYAAYNQLTCPKELVTPLDCAHWQYAEHKQMRAEWLLKQLTGK